MADTMSAIFGFVSAIFAAFAAYAWFRAGSAPAPWIDSPGLDEPHAWHAYSSDYEKTLAALPWNRKGAICAGFAAAFGGIAALVQASPVLWRLLEAACRYSGG